MTIKFLSTQIVIFFLAMCAMGQDGPQNFPDSPAGKKAAAFWNVVNSTGRDAIKSFIEDQMVPREGVTVEQRSGAFEQMQRILGGAQILKVTPLSESEISFVIKRTSGELEKIQIRLAQNSLVDMISLQEASEDDLSEEASKRISKSELISAIEEYLKSLDAKDEFSGTVLLAEKGKPIFLKAFGLANIEKKIPNNSDTKYNLGSINKLFTILSIGLLADEGRISFDDKIGEILPNYPNKDAREKVTIRHLLTMSSGIGDIFGDEYEATPKSNLRTTDSYLPLFASKPLAFEPGTDRQYSNGGFLVLGAIIEKVSGQTYYDFVRERIYKPIGMSDTEAYESGATINNLAEGYMYSEEKKARINNVSTRPARGSSGGGGYSTAPDMLKFANAIESGSFPMPNSLKQMKDPLIGDLARGVIRFGGGAPGINASIENRVADKYTIIVLANYSPPTASKVSRKIRGLLKRVE